MKNRTITTLLFAILVSSITFSQSKVKEKDIIGEWKFHLNLDKAIDDETKDSDNFEKIIVSGILKTVNKLVDHVDIKFHFKKDHTLTIAQKSNIGEDAETIENHRWKINNEGQLVTSSIKDGNQNFNSDNVWMLRKGKLISVDENKEVEENVWMERIK